MAERPTISHGMQVLTSDGEMLGTVEERREDGFMLRRMSGGEERIPDMWIHQVGSQVLLNRTGAEAQAGWKSMQFETSTGNRPGAPSEEREPAGKQQSWIMWLAIAVALLIAAFLILPNLT